MEGWYVLKSIKTLKHRPKNPFWISLDCITFLLIPLGPLEENNTTNFHT